MAQSYKTAIEFGLVYIPISLHACVKSHDIGFNMLYKKTKQRIKYRKTCEDCPANISNDDIVKGYEYQPGKYVTLSDEELEKIKSPKDKSIAIVEFVRQSEIDPIFYDRAFYAAPKGADKAFLLLLKALEEEKMVAIAKTVLGTKEQLVCLRAENGKMILSTLHFSDEIQEAPALKSSQLSKTELDLAKNLIKNMASHFQTEKCHQPDGRAQTIGCRNKKEQKSLDADDDFFKFCKILLRLFFIRMLDHQPNFRLGSTGADKHSASRRDFI